jgi:ABC-type lipoprotein release transport system permease subunit
MAFIKGLIPGLILTFVVAGILGSNGQSGDWLNVHAMYIDDFKLYWSWPLFIFGTGLSTGLFAMMD